MTKGHNMEYTAEDVRDVDFAQWVDGVVRQAHDLAIVPTIEAAITWLHAQVGERPDMDQEIARYHRGKELSTRFVLVTSDRLVDTSERAEQFFRTQYRITGLVVWSNAGYVATSPRYVAQGLRPRE